jgi:hypothetical protein
MTAREYRLCVQLHSDAELPWLTAADRHSGPSRASPPQPDSAREITPVFCQLPTLRRRAIRGLDTPLATTENQSERLLATPIRRPARAGSPNRYPTRRVRESSRENGRVLVSRAACLRPHTIQRPSRVPVREGRAYRCSRRASSPQLTAGRKLGAQARRGERVSRTMSWRGSDRNQRGSLD